MYVVLIKAKLKIIIICSNYSPFSAIELEIAISFMRCFSVKL